MHVARVAGEVPPAATVLQACRFVAEGQQREETARRTSVACHRSGESFLVHLSAA